MCSSFGGSSFPRATRFAWFFCIPGSFDCFCAVVVRTAQWGARSSGLLVFMCSHWNRARIVTHGSLSVYHRPNCHWLGRRKTLLVAVGYLLYLAYSVDVAHHLLCLLMQSVLQRHLSDLTFLHLPQNALQLGTFRKPVHFWLHTDRRQSGHLCLASFHKALLPISPNQWLKLFVVRWYQQLLYELWRKQLSSTEPFSVVASQADLCCDRHSLMTLWRWCTVYVYHALHCELARRLHPSIKAELVATTSLAWPDLFQMNQVMQEFEHLHL